MGNPNEEALGEKEAKATAVVLQARSIFFLFVFAFRVVLRCASCPFLGPLVCLRVIFASASSCALFLVRACLSSLYINMHRTEASLLVLLVRSCGVCDRTRRFWFRVSFPIPCFFPIPSFFVCFWYIFKKYI